MDSQIFTNRLEEAILPIALLFLFLIPLYYLWLKDVITSKMEEKNQDEVKKEIK